MLPVLARYTAKALGKVFRELLRIPLVPLMHEALSALEERTVFLTLEQAFDCYRPTPASLLWKMHTPLRGGNLRELIDEAGERVRLEVHLTVVPKGR